MENGTYGSPSYMCYQFASLAVAYDLLWFYWKFCQEFIGHIVLIATVIVR
jgi:hypothetical protein